jgi:hypothetical protein
MAALHAGQCSCVCLDHEKEGGGKRVLPASRKTEMTRYQMRSDFGLFFWPDVSRLLVVYVVIVTGICASTVCFLCFLGSFLPTRLSTTNVFLVSGQRASFFNTEDGPCGC